MKQHFAVLLGVLGVGLWGAGCGGSGSVGQTYANRAELEAAQAELGFVFLGQFGDSWPAKVTSEATAQNELRFELKSGVRQAYPGYDGYTLKLIRLAADDGSENVIAFRSKEKQMAEAEEPR